MDRNMQQRLQEYINAETGDSALYRELAKEAPNETAMQLLLEFSEDEAAHAAEFRRLYRMLYGRSYMPLVGPVRLDGDYREILMDRVLDESGDYRKYAEQYRNTGNKELQDAFIKASTDENVHALRLLYLLDQL